MFKIEVLNYVFVHVYISSVRSVRTAGLLQFANSKIYFWNCKKCTFICTSYFISSTAIYSLLQKDISEPLK